MVYRWNEPFSHVTHARSSLPRGYGTHPSAASAPSPAAYSKRSGGHKKIATKNRRITITKMKNQNTLLAITEIKDFVIIKFTEFKKHIKNIARFAVTEKTEVKRSREDKC